MLGEVHVSGGAGGALGGGPGGGQGSGRIEMRLLGVPHAVLHETAQVDRLLDPRHSQPEGLLRHCCCNLQQASTILSA